MLIIRVPRAGRSDRPVFIDGSWERGTFVRVHEGDRRADRDVARRMLADPQPDRDSTILNHGSIDDLDGDSVRLYRELFSSRRAGHPYLLKQGSEFLGAVGAWRAAPVTHAEGPTNSPVSGESSARIGESSPRTGESSFVARLSAAKHAPVSLVHEAILEVCDGKFLTFEQIAAAIGRSTSAVRNKYLKGLVSAGRLELQFPDNPHHPRQAYRSRAGGPAADGA